MSSSDASSDLGGRVRDLRHDRGLTLKALGQLAGLSHPFLSQVERGLARPSMTSVERIADALGVPVAQLWTAPRRRDAVQLIRRDETLDVGGSAQLRELRVEPGSTVEEWSAPGRRWPADVEVRTGEVLVYVARGSIEVELAGTVHALEEGDSVRFDGDIPHRLRRTGGTATRALIVAIA